MQLHIGQYTQKRVHLVWSQKLVKSVESSKDTTHESSRDWFAIKHITPVYQSSRRNVPQVHLPEANHVLRRCQVQLEGLRSGWDQTSGGSGFQACLESQFWWQACALCLVAACTCFILYMSTVIVVQQQSYEYVNTCLVQGTGIKNICTWYSLRWHEGMYRPTYRWKSLEK